MKFKIKLQTTVKTDFEFVSLGFLLRSFALFYFGDFDGCGGGEHGCLNARSSSSLEYVSETVSGDMNRSRVSPPGKKCESYDLRSEMEKKF